MQGFASQPHGIQMAEQERDIDVVDIRPDSRPGTLGGGCSSDDDCRRTPSPVPHRGGVSVGGGGHIHHHPGLPPYGAPPPPPHTPDSHHRLSGSHHPRSTSSPVDPMGSPITPRHRAEQGDAGLDDRDSGSGHNTSRDSGSSPDVDPNRSSPNTKSKSSLVCLCMFQPL